MTAKLRVVVVTGAAMFAASCASGSAHPHATAQSRGPATDVIKQVRSSSSPPLARRAAASVPLVQQVHAAAVALAAKNSGLPASTFTASAAGAHEALIRLVGKRHSAASGLDRQLSAELTAYADVAATLAQRARPLTAAQTAKLSVTDQQWVRTLAVIGKQAHATALENPPPLPLPAAQPKTGKH